MLAKYKGIEFEVEWFDVYLDDYEYTSYMDWSKMDPVKRDLLFDRFLQKSVKQGMLI